MERDRKNRPILSRAMALALAYLEIGVQVLSLSLLPPSNVPSGQGLPALRSEMRRASASSSTAPRSAARLLQDLFTSLMAEGPDEQDDDLEPAQWPHVEVVVRQKCGSQSILSTTPSPPRSSARLRTPDEGTPLIVLFRQVFERPIHLCRLTC
jgi:hypothetical protein